MGGFCGIVSKTDCVSDLFFGTDYHSHLGTHRGGMAVLGNDGEFQRAIHNIQNSPFRSKFENDVGRFAGSQDLLSSFAAESVGAVTGRLGEVGVSQRLHYKRMRPLEIIAVE